MQRHIAPPYGQLPLVPLPLLPHDPPNTRRPVPYLFLYQMKQDPQLNSMLIPMMHSALAPEIRVSCLILHHA